VTFTGTGFATGDTVTITVHEDPTWSYPDRQFKSVADANGAFVNRDMIVDKQDLGVTFTATAVAVPSGLVAQTVFTDGNLTTVSGTVTDAGTSLPLAGVTVSCTTGCNGTFTTSTDASGSYSFSGGNKLTFSGNGPIDVGLTFSKTGYLPGLLQLDNVANTNSFPGQNIALTPAQSTPTFAFDLSGLSKTFGDAPFSVAGSPYVTTNSDGTVSFALGAGSVGCTVSAAGLVTITSAALGASKCVVVATLAASSSFFSAGPATQSFNIAKANATISVTPYSMTYDGAAHTATATATGVGSPAADLSAQVTLTGTTHTDAGTYSDSWTFAGGDNYNDANGTVSDEIKKAASTTTVSCTAGPFTYTGSAQTPCTVSVTGAGGLSANPAASYTNNVDAGTATATYTYAGDANHDGSSDSKTFTIGKASSTTTVSCPASAVYTGSPLEPCTAAATGAGSLNVPVTPVTYTSNTDVGTAHANASYAGDANHDGSSGAATFGITKATSSTVVTCPSSVVYNGSAQTPCTVAVTGAGGLSLTPDAAYANNTNAGTASASYDFAGDANHTGSSDSKTFTIAKATSTTTVSCPAGPYTYNGAAQTPCSATVEGVAGLHTTADPTYANNVHAGTATASYEFAGDNNHEGSSGSSTFTIGKAGSTTVVTCGTGPFTYDGSPHTPCAVHVTGIGGLDLTPSPSYAANTDAGTATASYEFAGDDDHTGSSDSKTFTIEKASSVTTVTCGAGPFTYTGSALTPCSAAATGAGNLNTPVSVDYTDNTNAGTAHATATYAGDANHTGSVGSDTFTIEKAGSATTVTCPTSVVYNGTAQTPCSVAVTGANLSLNPSPSYSNNTNAGTATATYQYAGDANHTGSSDSKNFTVDKASSSTVITCPVTVTYDGTAKSPCTVAVTGAGGLNDAPTPGYTNNTDAGTATASYSYPGDANHTGSSDSKTFTIAKASSTTTVTCPASVTYNGSAQTPCSVSVTGAGGLSLAPTPNYSNNINAGSALASYTYSGDGNHFGSTDAKNFTIDKAPATVALSDLVQAYKSGNLLKPTVTTVPANVQVTLTFTQGSNVFTTAVSQVGVYAVNAHISDPNYTGSDDNELFVIYDASNGFVTGGGWINSPAGACRLSDLCAAATGKANFGFVSKYVKGQSLPTGDTQFQFQAGKLDFRSTAYDWLVISGARAQYKGSGTLNGVGGYQFILTAIDGDVPGSGGTDRFRIKIADANGNVVYDNMGNFTDLTTDANADLTNNQATLLGGGSIQIHK